jgi:hypothetical protein
MQRLKMLSPVAVFTAMAVMLSASFVGYFAHRIREIDQTQDSRSRVQAQIHGAMERRYSSRILETELLSRCGTTVYIVTLRDAAGSELRLYYDIDTGAPIRQDLLGGCPDPMTGSTANRERASMPVYRF